MFGSRSSLRILRIWFVGKLVLMFFDWKLLNLEIQTVRPGTFTQATEQLEFQIRTSLGMVFWTCRGRQSVQSLLFCLLNIWIISRKFGQHRVDIVNIDISKCKTREFQQILLCALVFRLEANYLTSFVFGFSKVRKVAQNAATSSKDLWPGRVSNKGFLSTFLWVSLTFSGQESNHLWQRRFDWFLKLEKLSKTSQTSG